MLANSLLSLCTLDLAWITSAFRRSGSYFVELVFELVELTVYQIKKINGFNYVFFNFSVNEINSRVMINWARDMEDIIEETMG